MSDILTRIAAYKRQEVAARKAARPQVVPAASPAASAPPWSAPMRRAASP